MARAEFNEDDLAEFIRQVPDPNFQVPDVIGAVEGWRAWGVPVSTPFGATPRLYSVTFKEYFWVPRRVSEATCPKKDHPSGVPDPGCTCGFYSAKTLDHLMSMRYHAYDAERKGMFHVVGKLANWGKVVEATAGWRSQFAYPVKLYVPFEAWRLAKPLSETYGVPVELANVLSTLRLRGE